MREKSPYFDIKKEIKENVIDKKIMKGRKNIAPVIYFNAFKHDFSSEPFTAIAYELIKKFESMPKSFKDKFNASLLNLKNNSGKLIKYTANSFFKEFGEILTQLATGNLYKVGEQALKDCDDNKNKTAIEEVKDWFQNSDELHSVIESIRECLKILTAEQKIYFIVDDLDRCRPDFAIELLEKIKHIFEVDNLIFLLTTDLENLGKSLKNVYGEITPKEYFRKFINMTFTFPKGSTNISKFLSHFSKIEMFTDGFGDFTFNHDFTARQIMQIEKRLQILNAFEFPVHFDNDHRVEDNKELLKEVCDHYIYDVLGKERLLTTASERKYKFSSTGIKDNAIKAIHYFDFEFSKAGYNNKSFLNACDNNDLKKIIEHIAALRDYKYTEDYKNKINKKYIDSYDIEKFNKEGFETLQIFLTNDIRKNFNNNANYHNKIPNFKDLISENILPVLRQEFYQKNISYYFDLVSIPEDEQDNHKELLNKT
ncbi:P-loop NTPase fold protein [Lentisphaerota bacterium WC36G]|nr:hypothetical protein LJT99_07350 [Lentisphaerae bacterium WC36]